MSVPPRPEPLPPEASAQPEARSQWAAAERGPVRARSPLPDMLRGLALLGILVVNMQDFAGYREWTQSGLDRVVQVITDVFLNGKAISLFAMLFGWGAAGLLARQSSGLFLLRHGVLLAVGLSHYVLLWHGDIISNYAVLGVALLLTIRMTARSLVLLAAGLGAWWLGVGLLAALAAGSAPAGLSRFSGLPIVLPGMDYSQMVADRASDFGETLLSGNLYNGPWLLALFCLGAALHRSGVLTHPHEHLPLLKRLRFWGLMVGLPLGLALAWLNTRPDYASGVLAVPVRMGGGLALALGYVGLLGLWAARGRLGVLRAFAASGRLAMSNYLAQSVIMTSVFYPYAGAQFGRWGAAACVALALAVGLAQLPLSAALLRRYGTGPLEALVRALMYGRRPRQSPPHS